MTAFLFEGPAWLLAKFYDYTHNYIVAISLIALVVMLVTAPLQLKATKGMLEMQKLQPELRKLQQEHRGDRTKLNEEMMKLYQEHKVNPLASCFPLLLQFPVFIIMFQVLHGLTDKVTCGTEGLSPVATDLCQGVTSGTKVFYPDFISSSSELYTSLAGKTEMISWGLDLSKKPFEVIGESFGKGLVYALLVVALGILYFVQQRMVAARATMSPTMSPMQQKLMQYLPVVFAVFLVFYLTGLVIYYMAQAIFRIGLQWYITKRFYAGEHSLGQQAAKAGVKAREMQEADPNGKGGGLFAQAKRELASAKDQPAKGKGDAAAPSRPGSGAGTSKRVTPPKNKPTPTSGPGSRPPSTGRSARPTPPAPRGPKKK
jgi:YidC/Oxa1 family membrane protein insertase